MANNKSHHNWTTQFETAKSLMVHTFTSRVQVKSSLKSGEVQVIVDGNIVNTYHSMPIKEYESLLLGVEDYAAQLQQNGQLATHAMM